MLTMKSLDIIDVANENPVMSLITPMKTLLCHWCHWCHQWGPADITDVSNDTFDVINIIDVNNEDPLMSLISLLTPLMLLMSPMKSPWFQLCPKWIPAYVIDVTNKSLMSLMSLMSPMKTFWCQQWKPFDVIDVREENHLMSLMSPVKTLWCHWCHQWRPFHVTHIINQW